jgi:hypothetical protein
VPGALLEPIGLLIPGSKAKTAYGALMKSGIVGSMYGSSLYVDPAESRALNAAAGGVGMGVLGYWAHKLFRNQVGGVVDDRIAEVGRDTLERPYSRTLQEATPEEIARATRRVELEAAADFNKPTTARSATAYERTRATNKVEREAAQELKRRTNRTKQSAEEIAENNLHELEMRSSIRGPRNAKLFKVRQMVDSVMQPIYNNVKKYSDNVAAGMRKVDFDTHSKQKAWTDQMRPFQEFLEGLTPEHQQAFHRLLLNQGLSKSSLQMAHSLGGEPAVNAMITAQKVLQEILGEYKAVGYKIKESKNYFPRSVKDIDGLIANHSSIIDEAMKKVSKKQNRTSRDEARVMERLLTFDPRFSQTSSNLQQRMIREVADDQAGYYHDPVSALYYYINTAAEDIATRKFFKSFGHKPNNKKGLDITGADIDKSIDSLVESLKKTLPDWKDRNDLVKLLRSRFAGDVHGTHGMVRALKNLSYAGTLGNFWSAMTQVGDIVFAFHKYGIAETVQSILGKNITNKEALGIDKAMQELNEAGRHWTATVADWAFKWGGFDAVDRFGKNVNINASLRANKKLALKNPDKFIDKWRVHFGDETEAVAAELRQLQMKKNEHLSDNLKLMLWNDLADTQPIGLSEMPERYLKMPNGRLFYAYKTFTLKQMNYMRETLVRGEGNPAKRAANLVYFTSLFVAGNAPVDYAKDFLAGKDLDFEDNVLDNIAGVLGTNKYAFDKSRGLGGLMMEAFKPVPLVQGFGALDTASQAVMGNIDVPGIAEKAPVVGKPYKALREWGYME